ncbi:hypothetical protein U737_05365 [Methylomonas sp. LW13]|uniref:Uncharacterized protein n=1 Tax=Methylomonas defluvii TaxID=3045149 RepID=A0ABU4UDE4_9GAMM|nr:MULTISPECIES: hypothetical protein [unclassified Methylomonas]MDX8127359.1 hypothetical protein [Methylomonas sp. OY6]PKD41014.1 hypothetical protein CWO84_07095 [Methylomonas sp. Kb3]QBC26396.1 hypothetical protein U737_05365 [Methylomonas sp. LW13]
MSAQANSNRHALWLTQPSNPVSLNALEGTEFIEGRRRLGLDASSRNGIPVINRAGFIKNLLAWDMTLQLRQKIGDRFECGIIADSGIKRRR